MLVNGSKTTPEKALRDGETISHRCFRSTARLIVRVHRHEPPVTSQPIHVVSISEDIVVCDKPSSIPVHSFPLRDFKDSSWWAVQAQLVDGDSSQRAFPG